MARLTPEQLEQQIHAVLRNQPPRRAPGSLEARVLGEIARRQALPWWRRSYAHWPMPMRIAFLLVGVAVFGIAVTVSLELAGWIEPHAIQRILSPITDALATLRFAGQALAGLGRRLLPSVSITWLYAALGVLGAAYALMFGLGAAAYKVLWQQN